MVYNNSILHYRYYKSYKKITVIGKKFSDLSKIKKLVRRSTGIRTTEYIRALGNAFRHGKLPVKCKLLFKKNHILIIIKDSGKGFNVKKVLKKFYAGKVYYNYHGLGIKTLLNSKSTEVTWNKSGNTIYLLRPIK